jgi:hypothetical protein
MSLPAVLGVFGECLHRRPLRECLSTELWLTSWRLSVALLKLQRLLGAERRRCT